MLGIRIDPLTLNAPPMTYGESPRKGWRIIAKTIINADFKLTEYIRHAQDVQEY